MSHYMMLNGKKLDPKDAAKALLPSDTLPVCPHCQGRGVGSGEAKLSTRFEDESLRGIPRQQDRWCLDCGHRWVTVLPPLFQAERSPLYHP